jgi:hypothetical protein
MLQTYMHMFWEKELSLLAYSAVQVLAQMLMYAPGGSSALQARNGGGKGTKNQTSIQSTKQETSQTSIQPTNQITNPIN